MFLEIIVWKLFVLTTFSTKEILPFYLSNFDQMTIGEDHMSIFTYFERLTSLLKRGKTLSFYKIFIFTCIGWME